jgi:3'(2'), 5'-bisphosphate nucleotidase
MGSCRWCINIRRSRWQSNRYARRANGFFSRQEDVQKYAELILAYEPFRANLFSWTGYGLVCAPSSVHAQVLEVVQEVLKSHGQIPWDSRKKEECEDLTNS